ADRNRSHWSTSKTPSYTKSVSWQHHLNLQKLINISHQLEITPVSDDSKPEILQLLNSVKEHIAELDQEIAVFCQKND
ncbi:hypothetical protein RNO20_22860, partial [Escherichia coli]|nr:hypothetical protein [Escherichia coli]